jgi:hypothetical protein
MGANREQISTRRFVAIQERIIDNAPRVVAFSIIPPLNDRVLQCWPENPLFAFFVIVDSAIQKARVFPGIKPG